MSEIGKALAKTGHTDIAFLAQQHRAAADAMDKWHEDYDVHRARRLLAQKAGDEAMVKQLDAEYEELYPIGEFSKIHTEYKASAISLCDALGLNPARFRRALA